MTVEHELTLLQTLGEIKDVGETLGESVVEGQGEEDWVEVGETEGIAEELGD